MRCYFSIFLVSIFIANIRAASSLNFTEILDELPPCSLDCIVSGFASLPSLLDDPSLSCSNITLQASLSACLQKSCNYTEQAKIAGVDDKLCEGVPIQSRVWLGATITIVFFPLAMICVALRIYSRYSIFRRLQYDDWLVILAAASLGVETGLYLHNCFTNGFGRHYWDLDPRRVEDLLKTFYVAEMLYVLTMTLIKASILLFYFRVFEVSHRLKRASLATLGVVVTLGSGSILSIMFQCTPVDGVWKRSAPSKCLNTNILAYTVGGVGIALDLVIICLPIPELAKLRMSWRKKLNLFIMFGVGGFACVTSMVRLKYLITFGNSTDQTWDNAIPSFWSFLELSIALITCCLPSMRALFSLWVPFIFDTRYTPQSPNGAKPDPFAIPSSTASTVPRPEIQPARPSNNNPTTNDDQTKQIEIDVQTVERKIMIRSMFDEHDNGASAGTPVRRDVSPTGSESTGMFALQGPRQSDEIEILGEDIALQDTSVEKSNEQDLGEWPITRLSPARGGRVRSLGDSPRETGNISIGWTGGDHRKSASTSTKQVATHLV